MAIIYGLKVNLSVAMVAMVNHTAVRLQHEAESNGTSHSSVTFEAREECEAENRSSSGGSQVNNNRFMARVSSFNYIKKR